MIFFSEIIWEAYFMYYIKNLLILTAIFLLSAFVAVEGAYAKGEESFLEATIVTADKREQKERDVPISMSVLSDDRLYDYNIDNGLDIANITPNFYITNPGAPSMTHATVRGINGAANQSPAVGFYVDGIYYPTLDTSLYDVERVEVLRGPQGTLYGRNTIAGVVNLVTKKPGNDLAGSVSAGYSSFDTYKFNAHLSGPVVKDKLFFKTAFRYEETKGWYEDKVSGDDEGGKTEKKDARMSLRFNPNRKLDFNLTYDYQQYDGLKNFQFALIDSDELRKSMTMDDKGSWYKDTDGLALSGEYALSGAKLVSVTSWHREEEYSLGDMDFTPTDIKTMSAYRDLAQLSQEFRLVSDNDTSKFSWLVGVFATDEDDEREYLTNFNFANMGMPYPAETLTMKAKTDTLNMALFGEANYKISKKLDVTLGLRYEYESKDFKYSMGSSGPVMGMMGFADDKGSADESYSVLLPKVAVGYEFSANIKGYASVTEGFRSGGFNDNSNMGSSYDPEYSWNYEAGFKSEWFDKRLILNAALFYIDWKDVQVEILTADTGTMEYLENAGQATTKGFEMELLARPVRGLEITSGFGYTDAEFDEYKKGDKDYSGKKITSTPEYTANLGATYRFAGGFFVNSNYKRFGDIYYDPENSIKQEAYDIVSAKVGYEFENFDIYFFGSNIFDEEYSTKSVGVNNLTYARAGAPRTVGVVLTGRF